MAKKWRAARKEKAQLQEEQRIATMPKKQRKRKRRP